MGTGELNAGVNPIGGVEILLVAHHATETGRRAGLMGHLARMQSFD